MNVVDEIEDVLRQEQELLLSGNYAALEALIERKTRLAEQLKKDRLSVSGDAVEALSRKASENEALLGAAQRGLKAALVQLRQLSAAETQTTYTKQGQRFPISPGQTSITQKL